jgi:hypothetical protein
MNWRGETFLVSHRRLHVCVDNGLEIDRGFGAAAHSPVRIRAASIQHQTVKSSIIVLSKSTAMLQLRGTRPCRALVAPEGRAELELSAVVKRDRIVAVCANAIDLTRAGLCTSGFTKPNERLPGGRVIVLLGCLGCCPESGAMERSRLEALSCT